MSPGPKLNLNDSWPINQRDWLANMRTDRQGWPQSMRTSELRWQKRWTPPSRRSSLKQAQLNHLGYFPGASPLPPIMVQFPYDTWVRHWLAPCNKEQTAQQPPPHQSLRAHRSQPPQAAMCFKLGLQLSQFCPCQTFHLSALPQSGTHLLCSSSIPSAESRITPPMVHLMIDLPRGPIPKPQRLMSTVGTTLHMAMKNCPKQHWRHPAMMCWPQGVLQNMTVMTAPTTVVMCLTRMSRGRMQSIPIWNQPLGFVSLVWTLRRWPLELHERGSERKSEPPAALPGAASGLRPNWSEYRIVTRLYGGATMKPSGQSRSLLSSKIAPPLKWTRWWSELTNYFESKRPPTWKSTHGNQRPGSMAGRKPLCNC